MRIGVTGGSGFIGRYVGKQLISEGHGGKSLDRSPFRGSNAKASFVECDITDAKKLAGSTKGLECIVHLAALKSMKESIVEPNPYNKVNIDGTINVLEAARVNGIAKVVFSSSSAVYGNSRQEPQHEGLEPMPINPYGISKLVGELYCSGYTENFGIETVSLRLFNVYGPGQTGGGVVPSFIDSALTGKPATIFGSGETSRDFVFVEDVAKAFSLAIRHSSKAAGRAINIGSGESHSIMDVMGVVEGVSGRKIEARKKDGFEGDLEKTLADISLAKKLLSWKPEHGFEQGMEKNFEWYSKKKGELK